MSNILANEADSTTIKSGLNSPMSLYWLPTSVCRLVRTTSVLFVSLVIRPRAPANKSAIRELAVKRQLEMDIDDN